MNEYKTSVMAAKRRVADICYKVSSLIIEAIAFAHWEIMKGISYLQRGKTMKKQRQFIWIPFSKSRQWEKKESGGGAVVIIQEGSMMGEGFILIL